MSDINIPDLGSIGSSLYRQWQQLSRNEQEEVLGQVALEHVNENITDQGEDLQLELEEEPTPF